MMRQITFYQFEIGTEGMVQAADGRYDLVRKPLATAEASRMTRTEARAALKDAGYACPKGTQVYWEKVGRVVYRFTTEALLSICESREELPLFADNVDEDED